mmetsp:Transcript_117140/g.203957  ORF Transcript_117140/g.203957 Transcript_117140/m.203957 type:complete len:184 (-) Transcript_117140:747-1298(-)
MPREELEKNGATAASILAIEKPKREPKAPKGPSASPASPISVAMSMFMRKPTASKAAKLTSAVKEAAAAAEANSDAESESSKSGSGTMYGDLAESIYNDHSELDPELPTPMNPHWDKLSKAVKRNEFPGSPGSNAPSESSSRPTFVNSPPLVDETQQISSELDPKAIDCDVPVGFPSPYSFPP